MYTNRERERDGERAFDTPKKIYRGNFAATHTHTYIYRSPREKALEATVGWVPKNALQIAQRSMLNVSQVFATVCCTQRKHTDWEHKRVRQPCTIKHIITLDISNGPSKIGGNGAREKLFHKVEQN